MSSAVVVLTWNGGAEAIACLQRVRQLNPAPDTVVVVDNDSQDGTPDQVAALFPAFLLIRNPRNLGYAGGMNIGIRALLDQTPPPDVIVLLNQDTLVDPGWLGALLAPFADPAVGAVGCKIRYPDGTLQHAGLTLDWPLALSRHVGRDEPDQGQYDTPRNVNFVTFAAAALRSAALQRIGLFDEGYTPAYFEDVDLCVRLRRAGYLIRYEPQATLIHRESTSQRDNLTRTALVHRGRLRFVLKTYALDEITGPFAQAERDLIERLKQPSEKRALRWAYDKTLADLPHIWNIRRETDQNISEATAAVQRLFLDLQHELITSSHRRITARLADIENLLTAQPALLAAHYTLLDSPPHRLDISESFRINVDVHNIGRIAWRSAGAHPIRLGYRWVNQSGARIAGLHRSAIPRDILPGEHAHIALRIDPPPQPGVWQLQISLVEEYIDWFSTYGVSPLCVDLEYVLDTAPRAVVLSVSVAAYDAIGGYILYQIQMLRSAGYRVVILAEHVDRRLPTDILLAVVAINRSISGEYHALAIEHLHRADLIILHYPVFYDLAGLIRDVRHGVVIFDYHGITPPDIWGVESPDYYARIVRGVAQLSLVQHADYAIGHSRFTCAELIATGMIDPQRVIQMAYPIVTHATLSGAPDGDLLERFGLHNRHVLLYVGRMARSKRVDMLIEALPAIVERHRETKLLLVGDDRPLVYQQYVREVAARAHELGVAPYVQFTGQVDDATLDRLYHACAVFVTASIHEGFCMPVVEAMAHGRPVVATRVTALPETVGEAGLLFEPDNVTDLADQICRLLDDLPHPGYHWDVSRFGRLTPATEEEIAALRQRKIGIVTPRYGFGVLGGAEQGIREWAKQLAARGYTVEALTTTTVDMSHWGDHVPPGVDYVNGVTIRRFRTTITDDRWFHAMREQVEAGKHPRFVEEQRFMERNLRSVDLERFIARHAQEYACLLVIPYLFGTSYWTIQTAPERSILIPCLHDEPLARLSIFRSMLEQAAAIFFNSEEEEAFATRVLGVTNPYRACLGFGFPDQPEPGNPHRFREHSGITAPFLLYAGRLEYGKNVPLLIDYFIRYKVERPGALTLALSGTGNISPPSRDDIVVLGMLPRDVLNDAFAGALALCQLSLNESFSLVLMESWLQGRPVIVHADCAVTNGHVKRSGGGYAVRSYEDFRAAVDTLLANNEHAAMLGARGRAYVVERYTWSRLLPRIEEHIARFSRPRPLYARLAQRSVVRALEFTRQRFEADFLDLVARVLTETGQQAHNG